MTHLLHQALRDVLGDTIRQEGSNITGERLRKEAASIGASAFFREKYPDEVTVYFIGEYSKEFYGGPHVKNTSEIGSVKIIKLKKIRYTHRSSVCKAK